MRKIFDGLDYSLEPFFFQLEYSVRMPADDEEQERQENGPTFTIRQRKKKGQSPYEVSSILQVRIKLQSPDYKVSVECLLPIDCIFVGRCLHAVHQPNQIEQIPEQREQRNAKQSRDETAYLKVECVERNRPCASIYTPLVRQ